LWIGEAQRVASALGLDPLGSEPLGPEVERLRRGDPPRDGVDHPVAGASGRRAGVLEEGQIGAGVALFVGEEQVVDGGIVLVDRLFHQAESHDPGVEVDVLLGVAGDRGDVVNALELHTTILPGTGQRRTLRRASSSSGWRNSSPPSSARRGSTRAPPATTSASSLPRSAATANFGTGMTAEAGKGR